MIECHDLPRGFYGGTPSEKDLDDAWEEFLRTPPFNYRAFVADIKANPGKLRHWDSEIPFDEFCKKVEAGEYD